MALDFILILMVLIAKGDKITYQDQISDFAYIASDPDNNQEFHDFQKDGQCNKTLQSDGDYSTGCQVKSSDVASQTIWGAAPNVLSTTDGMVGDFWALTIVPGINSITGNPYTLYEITRVALSFTGGCLVDMDLITQNSYMEYTTPDQIQLNVTAAKDGEVTTFTADLVEYIQ